VVVFAGQGDPRQAMELLWRTSMSPGAPGATSEAAGHRGPGPRPGLSVDLIVDTAIVVADAEGMAALSMRAVGERLGCTAMALYTYVPGKAELVELMYDRAHAELPGRYDLAAGWRATITRWVGEVWEFHLRHPWLLQVSQTRPVLGPHEYAGYEALLRILRETGLPARDLRRIAGLLISFVGGTVRTVIEARQAAATTGISDDEWWIARSSSLEEVAPDFGARFPTLAWMESQGAFAYAGDEVESYFEGEAQETLEAGLTILLDGIEGTMARGGIPTPTPPGAS
jgi:AcrR family transcriptional regulator